MPERRFRPALDPLDTRTLLSVPGLRMLHVSAVDPAVTPTTASYNYVATDWLGFHQSFATEATTDRAPVVFLGDSITNFWNSDSFPELGQAVWRNTFEPLRAENFGIPGDETQNLLWRVENGEVAGKPKVAVVMIGINNLLHGATAEETAAGVSAVVQAIHKESPRTQVVLLGILPVHQIYTEAPVSEVEQTNADIASVVRGPKTTFLDVSSKFLGSDGQINTSLYKLDGIHPSEAGYQLLANAIEPIVLRFLGNK